MPPAPKIQLISSPIRPRPIETRKTWEFSTSRLSQVPGSRIASL